MKFCLHLCAPNPMFNVKMPIGLLLPQLAEESVTTLQGCTLSVYDMTPYPELCYITLTLYET